MNKLVLWAAILLCVGVQSAQAYYGYRSRQSHRINYTTSAPVYRSQPTYYTSQTNPFARQGGTRTVYMDLSGDDYAVKRTAYTQRKPTNEYARTPNGSYASSREVYATPQWYLVAPASGGNVDVFYVESGQRKHMRVSQENWARQGWNTRYTQPDRGAVVVGGRVWY